MKINGKLVKVTYEETYKPDAIVIREPLRLPKLNHLTDYRVVLCQVLKAGILEDGREYQELRVVLEQKPIEPAPQAGRSAS